MLVGSDLTVRRGAITALDGVSLRLQAGQVSGVLGPNGAGKSTLLEALSGELKTARGQVMLHGRAFEGWSDRERARCLAVLPQSSTLSFAFQVEDVVAMGRLPHCSGRQADARIVAAALQAADAQHLAGRSYLRLSGGERQRVHLARVLAQLWPGDEGSVLLLDEIEKAHPDVYNILLQVFDDGRLTDGKGRVVDFTNTIIIATSNLGSDIIQRRLKARGAAGEEYEKTKAEVMDVLRGHFRPEFLNRIDELIVFHALGREEIRHIVGLQLDRVARSAASQGVTLTFDGTLVDHFAEEGYKPEFGARELKRLIRSELETALAREMLGGGIGKGDHAYARWDDKAERVAFDRKQPAPTSAEAPSGSAQPPGPPRESSKGTRKKKSESGKA